MSEIQTEIFKNIIASVRATLAECDKPILIAVDGRSGAGKSTLSKQLARELNATIILGDDFYSGGTDAEWRLRTPQEKVALCIDWKRIRREVLTPLLNNRHAIYHPFDFKSGEGLSKDSIELNPAKVIILDGAYSARPELHDLINIKILVELHDDTRRQRLLDREGLDFMANWHSIWDEAEDYYFSQICPAASFDFVV
jgi:uridine kinase